MATAYTPPRNGVLFSVAYAEAIETANIKYAMLETFELHHPAFMQDGAHYVPRIVNDYVNFNAVLESTAIANPGEAVDFIACTVDATGPDESDSGAAPAVSISIDGVSSILAQQLDLATAALDPVLMTIRIYASNDPSAPAVLPVTTMTLRDVVVGETRVTARAVYFDATNQPFPRGEYRRSTHPGLSAR